MTLEEFLIKINGERKMFGWYAGTEMVEGVRVRYKGTNFWLHYWHVDGVEIENHGTCYSMEEYNNYITDTIQKSLTKTLVSTK
jgi:hypothetical protein